MLLEKITSEELAFMENWHSPITLIESLFSNFDNLAEFDEEIFGALRLYQYPMISHESIIDENISGLTKKQQFKLKKNVGDIIAFGARKYGKTLCVEKLDMPLSMLHDDGYPCGCSSTDAIHLDGVLDDVRDGIENHPILKTWKRKITKSPKWFFTAKNNWKLSGINMNLKSKSPGHQFYGKHLKKLWIEEASFETDKVFDKRREALSEVGAVLRLSGMTNFISQSPAGKAFTRLRNKPIIQNLPQYVSPLWDEAEEQERVEEYGGKDTVNYRIFVKGEIVEDGISEFDMELVRECYQEKKKIKRFEITKDRYKYFESLIVVERPKNAERIFIASDIGESAGTDIIILSEVGEKYNYLYNIILYNLKRKQQLEIFKYLIEKLSANVIGMDCGDAMGRNLSDDLEEIYSPDNVVRYLGASKINVGFKKDPKTKQVIMKDGEPVYRQEFMKEWSVGRLKELFYNEIFNIPMDYKLDDQLTSVISGTSGDRHIVACPSRTGDHLFEAWRVAAIAIWLKKDFNQTPEMTQEWGTGVMGTI